MAEAFTTWDVSLKPFLQKNGGSERIRTSETVASPHDFESCAFNHSATLPPLILPYIAFFNKICYNR